MTLEGRLRVGLTLEAGRVARVAVDSTRLVTACRVLEGKPADTALDLLPRLFAVCGTAQRAAGEIACERALGIAVSPARAEARRRRVLAETAIEHGTRILMDWPAIIGEPPQAGAARTLRAALAPARVSGASLAGEALAGSPAPRLFDWLRSQGLADYGADAAPLMAGMDEEWLLARLAGDDAFCTAPNHDGRVYETGPLARWPGLVAEYGSGLLARHVARLIELNAALDVLAHDAAADEPLPPLAGSGIGLGVVEAARGRLVHRVAIADGIVRRYRILAPTEWNFHADGPLARGLLGDRADDGLLLRARLLVAALDPCVACDIAII
ncbi:MAG TPA: nickel-dependent hydrogenase large subunit [Azospirillaceae bacterium]|nr:nickel-dependent hydrogenase large subunit [Azospirillaceae bacterium]